jgi:hypothetical protein
MLPIESALIDYLVQSGIIDADILSEVWIGWDCPAGDYRIWRTNEADIHPSKTDQTTPSR